MISIARLMDRLRLTEPLDAEQLEELVDAAIAYIEGRTGRYFGPVVETVEYARGTGTSRLFLQSLPAQASTADDVTVTEQKGPGLTATSLVFNTDFDLRQRGRAAWLQRRDGNVWKLEHEYVITYEHGYSEDSLPADIEELVLFRVKHQFAGMTTGAVKSESVGPITTTYFGPGDEAGAPNEKAVIAAWKLMVFA